MSAFAQRFVGHSSLPSRLSEFDREHFFSLSKADTKPWLSSSATSTGYPQR